MSVILFLGFICSSTIYYFDVCLKSFYSVVGISLYLLEQFLVSLYLTIKEEFWISREIEQEEKSSPSICSSFLKLQQKVHDPTFDVVERIIYVKNMSGKWRQGILDLRFPILFPFYALSPDI